MRSVRKRASWTRATLVTSGVTLSTACFASEVTDFYEAPSAIVGKGGSAGDSGSGGASGGVGSAGSAGSMAAGSSGTGPLAGAGGGGAEAGTGPSGGAAGTSGADATGGTSGSEGGSAGEVPAAGGADDAGSGGSGGSTGSVSCKAHGEKARDFDGHCYLFVDAEVSFREAASDCEARGAHLVTLSSAERTQAEFQAENRFVWELGAMTPVWIGASDGKGPHQPGDGTYYEWVTGEPMTFDNWSEAQPNNSAAACQDDRPCSCDQSTCYEHCGFQWANAGKDASVPGWNDRLCEHAIAYVCEWDEP